jgi:hypothetical protein
MIAARPLQMLWIVGAVIFVIALFHTMSGGETSDWISNTIIQNTSSKSHKATGRLSLEAHVKLAEKIWAKTVRQRHEMRKDWEDQANMPL